MSRVRVRGARIIDPSTGRDELGELEFEDGRITRRGQTLRLQHHP